MKTFEHKVVFGELAHFVVGDVSKNGDPKMIVINEMMNSTSTIGELNV